MRISTYTYKLSKFISRNKFPLLIIIISLLYLVPFFQKGFPIGQDNIAQLARTAARIKAISDGQFPVRWAADLNYGYGHPGFIFFYSLPGYLGALFYFLGIGLESSYKLLMIVVFILTPISFYLWSKEIFEKNIAFVISILYGLAPYSFLDTFVRIHLGESLALLFIPLVLFFIERNFKKVSVKTILFGGLVYSLLIHSHTILGFIFSFIISGYILLKGWSNRKVLVANYLLIGVGLLLSSYFIIPVLFEGKYINSGLFLADWYKNNFLNFGNIIYSHWGFGSNVNDPGGLSAQIGPVHFLLAVLCIFLLVKKRTDKQAIIYWLSVFFIGIFMSLSISDYIWSRISLLRQFQFPWRFTAVTCFSASVLSGYVLSFYKNKFFMWIVLLSILVLGIPMSKFWKVEQNRPDAFYFNYPGTAAYHNEATTVWVAGDAYQYPEKRIEFISGTGSITDVVRKSNSHTFQLNSNETVRILDNTVYFPGWQATVDGKKVPIEFQDINYRGLITFYAPKGAHKVHVLFTESPIRLLSDMMSVIGICICIAVYIFRKKIDVILSKI
jgi:uncharacterized membrane protein